MFVLRKVDVKKGSDNFFIGDYYHVIHKEESLDDFNHCMKKCGGDLDKDWQERCYAFVNFDGDRNPFPLFKSFRYYIITEGGKTFDNLTYR